MNVQPILTAIQRHKDAQAQLTKALEGLLGQEIIWRDSWSRNRHVGEVLFLIGAHSHDIRLLVRNADTGKARKVNLSEIDWEVIGMQK